MRFPDDMFTCFLMFTLDLLYVRYMRLHVYGSCAMDFGSCLDLVIGPSGLFALMLMLTSFDFHVFLL